MDVKPNLCHDEYCKKNLWICMIGLFLLSCYQGIGFLYLKKPPLGPLPSSTAKWMISVAVATGVCHSVERAFGHRRVKFVIKG